MRLLFRLFSLMMCLALPAVAQERPNTILVLDASGSMWGQIDGINKIVIAREVVSDLLSDFPAEQNLGFVAYGHNTRGDCSDIETLVAPAPGTAGQIVDLVNALNPRGMTPMTDSVIAAAESLRYTENAATVILISDGIETCNPDPCEAARILAETGVDFTAHVVGFDVSGEAEALLQMQCIADETGGLFLTADNAQELSDALQTVVQAEIPDPVMTVATFAAQMGGAQSDAPQWYVADGILTSEPVEGPVLWTLTDASGAVLADAEEGNPFEVVIGPGSYTATAEWLVGEQITETMFDVVDETDIGLTVVFPEPPEPEFAQITFRAVEGSESGPEITDGLQWSYAISGMGQGMIHSGGGFTAELASEPWDVSVTREADGATASTSFVAMGEDRTITLVLPAILAEASVIHPASAPMGATVEVGWQGPGGNDDYIEVGHPGEDGYLTYSYVRDGNPVDLLMPSAAGTYEVRYVAREGRIVLARSTIEVTPVTATVTVAASAVAGETIEVGWQGPGYRDDYIEVAQPDSDQWINYTYTRDGNPADLLLPIVPGTYEVRYVMRQDRTVLATATIEVTPVTASVTAPATVAAGATIEVAWDGPNYRDDYIDVAPAGSDQWVNYSYTRDGNPARLLMPAEAGSYEVRYVAHQNRTVLASTIVEVGSVTAALTAPATAVAGATIEVGWTGPDYPDDYIEVGQPGEEGYVNYRYTRDGNPAQLLMPSNPGIWEIRYVQHQDRTVLARHEIEVTEAGVGLNIPATAAAGSVLEVGWEGPNYAGDYLSVARPDDPGYTAYVYTSEGNPAPLQMPAEPGVWEVRYVLSQRDTIIARQTITVEEVSVSLDAPDSVTGGSTIQIGWTGPDAGLDNIQVGPVGGGYSHYAYTSDGNPVTLIMPFEPGTYELRYSFRDREVLLVRPITITPAEVRLDAPARVTAGADFEVTWTGPDASGDNVQIGPVSGGYSDYSYTRDGNPVTLTAPQEPGSYEIRYSFRDRDNVLVVPLEVVAGK